jgi:hypothetical protein
MDLKPIGFSNLEAAATIAWYLILPAIGLGTVLYWTGSFVYWLFT